MQNTAHGSLATVLLLVPILAIPLLAIFGVPQLTPAVPSAMEDLEETSLGEPAGQPSFAAAPVLESEAFSVQTRELSQLPSVRGQSETAAPRWGAEEGPDRYRRSRTATVEAETVGQAKELPGELPLTWKSAVARLDELQIRSFRLEPGQQPGHFLFICSYTPQNSPRLSYRFEAEADEPLRAVGKVLTQIDHWMVSR